MTAREPTLSEAVESAAAASAASGFAYNGVVSSGAGACMGVVALASARRNDASEIMVVAVGVQ
jgi:hypothetical protein